eukprot:2922290-Rhodomonas_salina.2
MIADGLAQQPSVSTVYRTAQECMAEHDSVPRVLSARYLAQMGKGPNTAAFRKRACHFALRAANFVSVCECVLIIDGRMDGRLGSMDG